MIVGIFHQGSGLGNQLHRYVATRVLALDKGYTWGMAYLPGDPSKPAGFKGKDFMQVETHIKFDVNATDYKVFNEKKVIENEVDVRGFDPEWAFVENNTVIDGEFQDERYWEHREKEVDKWLRVKPLEVPDDVCVIGFRGGEFALYPDLFLTSDYWTEAMSKMKAINQKMQFEVHTDDAELARAMFPNLKVTHDMGTNWRSMRYAKYAIVANSSFFILPRWLRNGVTIAPRYWGRRNTKNWSLPSNYYKRFTYI